MSSKKRHTTSIKFHGDGPLGGPYSAYCTCGWEDIIRHSLVVVDTVRSNHEREAHPRAHDQDRFPNGKKYYGIKRHGRRA